MRTVLCVDDDVTLEDLSMNIRKAGYRCLTASSGDEAERLFVANNVDLVILHAGNPGLNGEELAAHLKRIRSVKILMLTRNLWSAAVPQSVDLLLVKTSAPHELLDAVASLTRIVDPPAYRARNSR